MVGTTISHYKILEKLGEGGMGVVYKAQDIKLDRRVALKFLPLDLTRNPEAKERFVREAKVASSLQHRNICVVYEIDETDDGRMFISMEHLEGEALKQKIQRGPLKLEQAIDFAVQIAEGLADAHRHGIIHRDIKPANVVVTTEGVAKIVDFGLAKLTGRTMLTREGATLGTAAYMSPEQARGEPVDHRTDVWSLGVIIYESITGQLPFKGEYENAVIYSILNTQPEPLTALRTAVPMDLERVVEKCLAKNPGERYQRMDEVLVDLRRCAKSVLQMRGEDSAYRALPPQTRRRLLWFGATLGLIAVALTAYILLSHEERSPSHLKMIAVLPFENLGSAEDEYFTDGLTEEITSRLSAIRSLGVISRTSAVQYKKTQKTLPVIARELGVDYILEGTVRWERSGENKRLRITPQLIQVSGDRHLWAENIDRTLDDIFLVQTEIATRVVSSLGIVLGESEKGAIEATPTNDLDAYQAYLRGLSFSGRYEEPSIKMAIEMFERAIALDSTFALAYAQLSLAHLQYYWYGHDRTKERIAVAKQTLDKAFALAPDLPMAYLTLGYYYYWGLRDYEQALKTFSTAKEKLPNDSRIHLATGFVWRREGRFEEAAEEMKRAFILNPKAADEAYEIGITLTELGIYTEAETYFDRAISLLPDQRFAYLGKAEMYLLWLGDTTRSRKELERVPADYYPWESFTWLDIYNRNYSSALDRLARVSERASVIYEEITPLAQLRGLIYRFMDESVQSRIWFDSARVYLESEIAKKPDDDRSRSALGIAYAGLGRKEDAVREAEFAVKLLPLSKDAYSGVFPLVSLAEVYVMVGNYEAAMDKIEFLLALHAPKWLTVPLVRLDPTYEPLRGNPRFEALLRKYEWTH